MVIYLESVHSLAAQLFSCLLPPTLRKYLMKQDAILVLLACGATITQKPSFDNVLGLATR